MELISHHLPWTNSELNVTWLGKQNHDGIYQATVRHDADIFSVPKIHRLHVQPVCQNDILVKLYPITLTLTFQDCCMLIILFY